MINEKELTEQFLPDRLHGQPPVYKGLTNKGLMVTFFGSLVTYLFVFCLFIGLFFGWSNAIIGVGLAVGMAMLTVVVVAGALQKMKRGKPYGYHTVALQMFLQKHTPLDYGYTMRSGYWDYMR